MAKVLLEVLKGWNEGGITLQVGARISVEESRGRTMCRVGYARKVQEDEPYSYPADDEKHQVKQIQLDEPEIEPEPCSGSCKSTEPDEPEEIKIPQFESIDFLGSSHVYALRKAGINVLADLKNYSLDDISNIKGIGDSTARKLYDYYNELLNPDYNKDTGMEIFDK